MLLFGLQALQLHVILHLIFVLTSAFFQFVLLFYIFDDSRGLDWAHEFLFFFFSSVFTIRFFLERQLYHMLTLVLLLLFLLPSLILFFSVFTQYFSFVVLLFSLFIQDHLNFVRLVFVAMFEVKHLLHPHERYPAALTTWQVSDGLTAAVQAVYLDLLIMRGFARAHVTAKTLINVTQLLHHLAQAQLGSRLNCV